MNQDDYNARKRKEELFHLFKESVLGRLNFSIIVSTLSATLLIVATFNKELIPVNDFTKTLLTILLLLIPSGLFLYLYELNQTGVDSAKALKKEINEDLKQRKKNIFLWFSVYFPWIGLAIISFVIFSIIWIIWR
ncbi:MAG: hypothetical protein PHI88_00330 [Candidatus Pacebacteria bacterium]|nr:hypothetical protein [Candidatus Paceibacterota bacterium]